jgi:hypothetical protein
MRTDFFISYTSPDAAWAEWVGWVLEEAGASVVLQAWDFAPGSNFVLEMQRAAASAERTIAILSPDYLKSRFGAPEWAAAFAQDPEGMKRSLIPVRVHDCALEGILRTIVHIDLVDVVDEATARKRLLDGVSAKRGKPERAPMFPGEAGARRRVGTNPKPFPGEVEAPAGKVAGPAGRAPYMPRVRGAISDVDRTRFMKQAFETVRSHFQSGLEHLGRQPAIDVDFTPVSPTEFSAEVFVRGERRARCRIWVGGMFGGNEICYYEGPANGGNALHESLGVADDLYELALSALMKMGFGIGHASEGIDLNHMSGDEAAEYLWRRFVSALE